MNQWIAATDSTSQDTCLPFDLTALALKTAGRTASFVPADQTTATLKRIQNGWRPTRERAAHAASALNA
jgi:hypothetical protein